MLPGTLNPPQDCQRWDTMLRIEDVDEFLLERWEWWYPQVHAAVPWLMRMARRAGVEILPGGAAVRIRGPQAAVDYWRPRLRPHLADVRYALALEASRVSLRMACIGCLAQGQLRHMPLDPKACCFTCWFGLERSDPPGQQMRAAVALLQERGPAYASGVRQQEIEARATRTRSKRSAKRSQGKSLGK